MGGGFSHCAGHPFGYINWLGHVDLRSGDHRWRLEETPPGKRGQLKLFLQPASNDADIAFFE